jgi:hypothetical protein
MVLFAIASGTGWLAVAGAGGTTTARAAAPSAVPIAAAIAPDGTVATPADGTWTARKLDVGRYELSFAHDVDLAIRSWTEPADVTVQPRPGDVWLVTFAAAEVPVDTAFTFQAAPLP